MTVTYSGGLSSSPLQVGKTNSVFYMFGFIMQKAIG